METVNFIGLVIFTWLFVTGAAPIQYFKKLLNIHNDSKPKKIYSQLIQKLVNCALCSGFWIGFIYYAFMGSESPLLMACIVSYSSNLLYLINYNLIGKYLNKL